MKEFLLKPFENEKDIVVTVPGSKSITNRALLLAALSNGKKRLKGVLFSEDSRVFMESLSRLGFEVHQDEVTKDAYVTGMNGEIPNNNAKINVKSAGTAARFLAATLALSGKQYELDSSEQMKQRPMKELLVALEQLGCKFEFLEEEYSFPFKTLGRDEVKVDKIGINIDKSSQFLSALLLNHKYLDKDLKIELTGKRTAKSYVVISEKMIEDFEKMDAENKIEYQVEPDVSAACYFYGMAALNGGTALVKNVHFDSVQGDIKFLSILEKMGCKTEDTTDGIKLYGVGASKLEGIDVDMSDCSDQTMTLAAIAPFASGKTTITGIGHIRGQESDRIAAICTELNRLGVKCDEGESSITIYNSEINPARISTYEDHRMAMAFSLIGTVVEGIVIDDPMCCKKTFENYFTLLTNLGLSLQ